MMLSKLRKNMCVCVFIEVSS